MLVDPVRTKGVRCGYCARCSSCYRERILRGSCAELGRPINFLYAPLFKAEFGHERDCLGTLERSQWTGLRLSLTMPCNDATGVVQWGQEVTW